ncbi:MAG: molybdopterin molybdotransferase MoeA [Dehalococcoidia bacterium]|nr:molybdopterin molybdotransferase MoeA [Dehalococcoidia bacterium]
MLTVEEALDRILSNVTVLEPEEKPILEALGQVLAENVYSNFQIPPLDNSAMDGYALRSADTVGATEELGRELQVIGEVAAGYIFQGQVDRGQAVRIMTGAPVPGGADAIVQYENTSEGRGQVWKGSEKGARIAVFQHADPGENIRHAGEDIAAGSLVFPRGAVLRPQEIGVLASLGRAKIWVIRRPVVSVLATGDELVEVGQPLGAGQIYNSNSYSIASQVRKYGGIPRVLGIARDNLEDLKSKIEEGLEGDMLLTSAGVSVGEYDMVRDVLASRGEIGFWKVRMRPGKPLAFGTLMKEGKTVPHLGLPGNPVSSMIAFEQFARPSILKMMGKTRWVKPTVDAVLLEDTENQGGRRFFARASVEKRDGQYYARITGPQGSGILTSMAAANGLVVVPEHVALARAGEHCKVQMLDWTEE